MRSSGINGERELRGQPANPGSPGKKAVKMECGLGLGLVILVLVLVLVLRIWSCLHHCILRYDSLMKTLEEQIQGKKSCVR